MKSKCFASVVLLQVLVVVGGSVLAGPPRVPVRVHVDSESDGDRGVYAMDGNPATKWHTPWGEGETKHPHQITVDLTRSFEVTGFSYLPRSGGGNGTIKDYELYIGDDLEDLGQPVAKGTFAADGDEKDEKHVKLPAAKTGRFVRLRATSEVNGQAYTSIAELRIEAGGVQFTSQGGGPWDPEAPLVPEKPRRSGIVPVRVTVDSQSLGEEGFLAMDGDRNTVWRTRWEPDRRRHPHEITIDLGESSELSGFTYLPCVGGGNGTIKDYELYVSDDERNFGSPVAKGAFPEGDAEKKVAFDEPRWGRYVKLRALSATDRQPWASIAELRILSEGVQFKAAPPDPEEMAELEEFAQRGRKPAGDSWEDVLDLTLRTLAFVERRSRQPKLAAELRSLEQQIGRGGDANALRDPLRRLRRRIILAHPDLNFRQLLINKRPPPGYSHMCDQYLGRHSRPGPGLVVLDDWKNNPRPREILKGKLPEGSVLHPDLSFDGRRVLFSFCDHTEKDTKQRRFLIYEASIDGSRLRQLTGTPDDPMEGWEGRMTVLVEDFDPCYLPDGGFAFITTRSQSFGRCHGSRYVPTYMLYRAEADGSGIRQLSFGEANEWDPSVMHDGRIVYTRWDYINRHDTIFQSLWTIAPDGTGTAHFYGNYSRSPCMIAEAHAVPGSHQVVATATAHHSYTSGSSILIDPRKGQDNTAPLTRVTPEFGFPEAGDRYAGGKPGACVTPFPVNKDLYFLAATSDNHVGQGSVQATNAYAIYLVDMLGGRELIYRDPNMSCCSPIPVKPRFKPPAIPSQIVGNEDSKTGVFYVQDVHRSTQPMEPGTIRYLRINRIYGQPTNGKPQLSLANNEIIKGIVGTVPVGRDGSTAFRAPAGVPLQLQALDENGMAVMTMRSLVYLQPGEVASCVGCHEPRGASPERKPLPRGIRVHKPTPPAGPQYAGGFSFAKTVQPVLDRYCIECHGLKKRDAGLNLLGTMENGYSASHNALTGGKELVKIAYRNQETPYSKPKEYYAHAGRLAKYLLEEHQDEVKLGRDDFQRIADWLDLNAQFYGDYSRQRDEDRRISGEGEKALREHAGKLFGAELARQPLAALVNVAMPHQSRILKAPLAANAGGWGQIGGGWRNTRDAGYREMLELVEACIEPHHGHDICGTCGRVRCVCGCCWTRRIREARQNPPEDFSGKSFEPFANQRPDTNLHQVVPKDGCRLVRVDSEETAVVDGAAANALDDDPSTYWHTQTEGARPAHPHEIVIDLGKTCNVSGFQYIPRDELGDVKDCEFYVSENQSDFGDPVARGTFTDGRSEKFVTFDARPGRYVLVRALSAIDGGPYTTMRELFVLSTEEVLP